MIYILTGEGRALPNSDGTYTYEYHMKDHLGNTRVAYTEDGNITQTADYYPFGMQHESNSFLTDGDQNYLYNGKELQNETGWYDYGARMYDATLGRWHVVDPKIEDYYNYSPYNYVTNRPIMAVDPNGEDVYIVIYDNESGIKQAARTRINEIKNSTYYNSKSDFVYPIAIGDLGILNERVQEAINYVTKKGYGKTVELSVYSHGGGADGPLGEVPTTGIHAVDVYQMDMAGWEEIDFNFDPDNSIASFYGCQLLGWSSRYGINSNVEYTAGFAGRASASYSTTKYKQVYSPNYNDNVYMTSWLFENNVSLPSSLTYSSYDFRDNGWGNEKFLLDYYDLPFNTNASMLDGQIINGGAYYIDGVTGSAMPSNSY